MTNKDIDPERDGLPWAKAFSEYAEPKLSQNVGRTAREVEQTIGRLEKMDRRWLDPKHFSRDVFLLLNFGEDWQHKIDETLLDRAEGIEVVHNYRHAHGLLYGWFINQLRTRKMRGFACRKMGGWEPINSNLWGTKPWYDAKDKLPESRIDSNGDLYLDGERFYNLHIVDPERLIKAPEPVGSASQKTKAPRERDVEKAATARAAYAAVRAKAKTTPGTSTRAKAEVLAKDKSLGFSFSVIQQILENRYPPDKRLRMLCILLRLENPKISRIYDSEVVGD